MTDRFIDKITQSYQPKGEYIQLGSGILNGEIITDAKVNLALKMMNRHGMVAGATGTGKTRTLQLIAEQLSDKGVPVFMLDVKGDLSGLSEEGKSNEALIKRGNAVGVPFKPTSFPIEIFSLTGKVGIPMRITVADFGSILLSRVLDLNETQTGVLGVIFKYAEDNQMPIVNLADLKKLLPYLSEGPGAAEIKDDYGKISTASAGAILRKIIAAEQQGIDQIFGEKEFDIQDLFNKVDGKGVISLLNISDSQDKPLVFSTFLLSLLAQLFRDLPEVGDLEKPKLVFFFDEAHLLFKDASKALLSQVEQIIRLIRSKGVGVFFCTQAASDIPESVLGQLGSRVQHALRAFTPKDVDDLKKTVQTYPHSEFYKIDKELTSLGIGEAMITVLNDKGIPTEVVATHLVAARAVMGPAEKFIEDKIIKESELYSKYWQTQDRRSAKDIIEEKIRNFEEKQSAEEKLKEAQKTKPTTSSRPVTRSRRQTPLEAAQATASRTLAREGVKLLSKLADGILKSFLKRK